MSAPGKSGFGSGLFGKESGTYEVYLNLTPLMDVMSNILFFLLAAFGTSIVAILPATIPVASNEESSVEKDENKVTVNLRADASGFTVTCESQTITRAQLQGLEGFIPKKNGDFDRAQLTALLRRIKERYPESNPMMLVPDDNLRYEDIVKIMDAARELKLADNRRIILFSEVVLSGMLGGLGDPGKKSGK
jgi:biopolymer transport protein ExbD